MTTYTAFCQETDQRGTIWISSVEADDVEAARIEAIECCASDWGWEDNLEDIHCLGLATGDVEIVYWDDVSD